MISQKTMENMRKQLTEKELPDVDVVHLKSCCHANEYYFYYLLNMAGEAITRFGFMNCKILCSGLMMGNIVCGFFYLPKSLVDTDCNTGKQTGPKYSLKIQGKILGEITSLTCNLQTD